jgi:hypothetical protein
MKISRTILAVCGLALAAVSARGQSPAPAPSASPEESGTAQPTPDFSQFKTADDLWAEIEKMDQEPGDPNASPEAVIALLQRLTAATTEFQSRYPKDARRWDAKLIALKYGAMLQ